VYLSYAHERYRWGQSNIAGPSPFLMELPPDLLQWEEEPLSGWPRWRREQRTPWSGAESEGKTWSGARSAGDSSWDTVATDDPPGDSVEPEEISDLAPSYRKGERVVHREFGPGTIRAVSGTGRDLKLTVRFDRWGEKKLIARFARLEKEW
jgi:DNA helicase-2/ATP-dependent DNA helicase PcrA